MTHKGFFITVEGIEGSGKSSLLSSVEEWLRQREERSGRQVIMTREPGGTALGKKIREVLLAPSGPSPSDEEPEGEAVHPLAELLLFSADRAQHVNRLLRPALEAGKIVVCDRYIHSTLAYQGSARGVSESTLRSIVELSTGGLLPDLVLLLDLEPEAGLARAKSRQASAEGAETWSRFEEEKLEFHRAVRNGFRALAAADPARFAVLDAAQSKSDVREAAITVLEARLP